jgi:superfamily I DNA/RNA helicase
MIRSYNTDAEEAAAVVKWLTTKHHPGSKWSSMAILARTNAQLEILTGFLDAHDIPYMHQGPEHAPGLDDAAQPTQRRIEDTRPDAVALSTIHRSKGLEFKYVAVIGLAEGQLPHYTAETPEQLAEEQRLAYVALSRAEESLLMTWSKATDDKRFGDREPSRFLLCAKQAVDAIEKRKAPLTGEARKAKLDEIRAELAAAVEKSKRLENN